MTADIRHGPVHRVNGRPLGAWRPWPRHLLELALAMAILFVLSASDIASVIDIWSRTGAFHHCFLIPPIILWLVWQRRAMLARLSPEYSVRGAALVALGSLLWLVGAAGYVAILRQAGLVLSAQGLVIALLGVPAARALLFPLGFSLFLIPLGSEFEPILQTLTARMSVALLHMAGTPAVLEGVFIETPAGLFRVAEACSGTAFLLAMAAYGALVCALFIHGWRRRVLFMMTAMLAALLANGLRAFAIMKLANLTSIRNPMVQDHILFGWLLFAMVLGLLMLGWSRLLEAVPDPTIQQGVARNERAIPAVYVLLIALLLLPRLWLPATDSGPGRLLPQPVPPIVAGWQLLPGVYRAHWQPHFTGATWIGQWRYRRGSETADLAVVLYDRQEEGRELIGFGQGAVAPDGDWALMAAAPSPHGGRGEWLRGPGGQLRYAATFYLVGGQVMGNPIEAKLAAVRTRLFGGEGEAAAILVSAPKQQAATDFIKAAGSVQEMADRARGMR